MNWNDLKLFTREELLEMVPDGFTFKTTPWTHQIAAFIAEISPEPNEGLLSALDLGTGKTKVAIDCCRYWDRGRGKIKVLVVCLNAAVENIRDEVYMHSDFTATCLRGNVKERWANIRRSRNFYIINFESLRGMLSSKVETVTKTIGPDGRDKFTRKNKMRPDLKLIDKLIKKKFDVLIIDESHLIKSPDSLNFKLMMRMSRKINNRILLTGTPFGNTLLDVWTQYFIIDFGKTYGTSISRYRLEYFEDKGWFGPDWRVTLEGKNEITKKLFTKAIRYEESEVDELPPKTFRTSNYHLSLEQRDAYNDLVEGIESEFLQIKEEEEELGCEKDTGTVNRAMIFRQIVSGFVKRSEHTFKKNPKLDLFMDIVNEVVESHKVVVFTKFIRSQEMIEARLKKAKIEFRSLHGAIKDKYAHYNAFQKQDKYRVMVANIKSGGTSINLTAASYCIHFDIPDSVIDYKQSVKRVHRGGQANRCFFYCLLGRNTLEQAMYKNLQAGVDAFAKIMDRDSFVKALKGE